MLHLSVLHYIYQWGKKKSINHYSPEDPVVALEGKAYLPGYVKGEGDVNLRFQNCQVPAYCSWCHMYNQNSPFKGRPKFQWHCEREMRVARTPWFVCTCRAMVGVSGRQRLFLVLFSIPYCTFTSTLCSHNICSVQANPRLQWGRGSHCSASVSLSPRDWGMSSGVAGNPTGKTTVPVFALPLPGLLNLFFLTQQQSELSSELTIEIYFFCLCSTFEAGRNKMKKFQML